MSFLKAIESGLINALNFSGRAGRGEFWWFVLFFFITFAYALIADKHIATAFINEIISDLRPNPSTEPVLDWIVRILKWIRKIQVWINQHDSIINVVGDIIFSSWALTACAIFFIPMFSLTIRRLHDTNRSFLWLVGYNFFSLLLVVGLITSNYSATIYTIFGVLVYDLPLSSLGPDVYCRFLFFSVLQLSPIIYFYYILCQPSDDYNGFGHPPGSNRYGYRKDRFEYVNGIPVVPLSPEKAKSARAMAQTYYATKVQPALTRDMNPEELYRAKYDLGPDVQES